ncbi:hypothetical protein CONCODRAFT_9938 [Conidiobolus coronatus NRRL 28638]|uniref:Uncharacterized protein n=1 Tax=Conidiobolus coronatus (strain ATCC 28846 / CBS 209.66 / NRRL 28638) TaxID=796925 RepID=A0A137NYR4_CONC2|nr:hypothetical protein CONCODRAFT_9938 [Conidiobolus coronatus NRRL 28638]|eukprot:KXN67907.1 hypothetical protein CONCODRAFT_9938 [Conidiobolus coronatus NRRL 28638]
MLVHNLLNLVLIYSVVGTSSSSSSPTSSTLNCPPGTEYCQSENICKIPGQQPTEPNRCTSGLVVFQGDGLCYPPTFPPWGGNQCPANYEYCSYTNTCKLITSGGGGNGGKCPTNTVFNTKDKLCHVTGKPPINGSCDPGDIFNPEDGLCHCQGVSGVQPILTCPDHYKLNSTDSLCHYVLQGSS